MRRHRSVIKCLHATVMITVAGAFISCKHTPEGVLDQEEMAQLMADIHTGEAMIDFNYSTFPNDSTRKLLKQSIYASHNVTAEDVDTSFVWYGNHIEDYIKVYDRTIAIIQERQRDVAATGLTQISVAGDSVQVWAGPERLVVGRRMPSRIIGFNITPDSTWQKGDIYTLSYKLINTQAKVNTRMLVDYSDGTTAYVDEPDTKTARNFLKLQVDSTLTPLRIYGYMCFSPEQNISFEVDSMSLTRVRHHLVPNFYAPHKTFGFGTTKESEMDSNTDTRVTVDESHAERKTFRNTNVQPRRLSESSRKQSESEDALPEPSSQSGHRSEHREDASQHKPTPAQRREAARQRTATTRQKSKAGSQSFKPINTDQKAK